MRLPNFKCNTCDGIYSSFDIHFTSNCDNCCSYCIDSINRCHSSTIPDVDKIIDTIKKYQDGFDDVLFLSGEPCLYLEELIDCIKKIKQYTNLKVYVTTSVPYTCSLNREKFIELIELVDGLNISAQHYCEDIADEIRHTTSQFDRQEFYSNLPYKSKIRINLNLLKSYLDTREEIINCLHHYDNMGFGSILLRELQHSPNHFVSYEAVMGIKLPSAYAYGCQTNLTIPGETFSTAIA